MSLSNRKRLILAKIETTYGTDSTPTGAANAILVSDLKITPIESQLVSRDLIRPYFGNSEQLAVACYATVGFSVELQASGTLGTAPKWGPLLRGCAFNETISAGVSVVYAPVSNALESLSIYVNVDGVLHKLLGSRGTVSFNLDAGGIPKMQFQFTGLFAPVTDTAAPTVDFSGFKTPLTVNSQNTTAYTLHGVSAVYSKLSIDMACDVKHRTVVGADLVVLTDRKPAGSTSIEMTSIATKDWFTAAKLGTTGALSITHGITAGYKVKVDAPAVQISKPDYGDEDNVVMLNMGLAFVPGSSGNDELTITCQ